VKVVMGEETEMPGMATEKKRKYEVDSNSALSAGSSFMRAHAAFPPNHPLALQPAAAGRSQPPHSTSNQPLHPSELQITQSNPQYPPYSHHTSPPSSPHSHSSNSNSHKTKMKKRFVWPDSLHSDFIRAIFAVGLIHCNTNMIKATLRTGTGIGAGEGFPDYQIDSIIHKLRLFNAQQMSMIEQKNQKKRSSSVTTMTTTSTATTIIPSANAEQLDELANMNKLINTQVELLERYRHSLMKQISIRDRLSNAIAAASAANAAAMTTTPATAASSISTVSSSTLSLSSFQQRGGARRDGEGGVRYLEEGVDLGKGLIEIRDDHSDGSSTRSVIAPAAATTASSSRPHASPTNTSGISSVAGATRHIVMPPPVAAHQPSSHGGSYHSLSTADTLSGSVSANPNFSRRTTVSNTHFSDGGRGSSGAGDGAYLPAALSTNTQSQLFPAVAPFGSGSLSASSPSSSCDPTAVNRHRSELYMVSAMRSHMNMHRELLQFNSQYTLPVILPCDHSVVPASSASAAPSNSFAANHHSYLPSQQQFQQQQDSSLQEAQRFLLTSPSSDSLLQSFDPTGDHNPLLTADTQQSTTHSNPNPYDLQLLSSIQQQQQQQGQGQGQFSSSCDLHSFPRSTFPPCDEDDEDLDTSLFDFLF
jgi:hypothetical protein